MLCKEVGILIPLIDTDMSRQLAKAAVFIIPGNLFLPAESCFAGALQPFTVYDLDIAQFPVEQHARSSVLLSHSF